MSSSQRMFKARNSGRPVPEKSNFAQTCNLLSQFIKEKGCLSDLNLEIKRNLEASVKPESSHANTATTMNLLNNVGKFTEIQTSTQDFQQANFLPQCPCRVGGSPSICEDDTNKASPRNSAMVEHKSARMTIFYAGQVMVFDNFPSDKAREVFFLASKGSSHNANGLVFPPGGGNEVMAEGSSGSGTAINSDSKHLEEQLHPQTEANNGSDLPIARRASLHRFLAKRKDRAIARAPYQVHYPSPSSSKNEEQLELRL